MKFYEQDASGKVIWEDEGKFTEADVHHQYAIALKTPSYRKPNIEESVSFRDCLISPVSLLFLLDDFILYSKVNVYIQLYRPGDSAISEPVEFRYKPSHNNKINDNRKRQRVSSFYDSDSPLPAEEHTQYYQPSDSFVPQDNTLSIENEDIEKWMDELNNLEFNAEGDFPPQPNIDIFYFIISMKMKMKMYFLLQFYRC